MEREAANRKPYVVSGGRAEQGARAFKLVFHKIGFQIHVLYKIHFVYLNKSMDYTLEGIKLWNESTLLDAVSSHF